MPIDLKIVIGLDDQRTVAIDKQQTTCALMLLPQAMRENVEQACVVAISRADADAQAILLQARMA